MLDAEMEETLETWRTGGQTPAGRAVETRGQSVFCCRPLIALSWKRNELCREFSGFIVSLMGFFFPFFFPLVQSHSVVSKSLPVALREMSPSRKETTHTTDDSKQHGEANNNNMEKTGWRRKKKKHVEMVFLGFAPCIRSSFRLEN